MLNLAAWPPGIRVIVRKERPHPGAQLRLTDLDGHRLTCFATCTKGGQLADLELRHRRRARCEDRIRCAKDTGLRNLPLHGFTQNQIWAEIVALASQLAHPARGDPRLRQAAHPQQIRQISGVPFVVLDPAVGERLHPERMGQVDLGARRGQGVRAPVPAVRCFQDDPRGLPGAGDLRPQLRRAVRNPHRGEPPPVLGHPHQHAAPPAARAI
jgi:Transposase DDE domain group 1